MRRSAAAPPSASARRGPARGRAGGLRRATRRARRSPCRPARSPPTRPGVRRGSPPRARRARRRSASPNLCRRPAVVDNHQQRPLRRPPGKRVPHRPRHGENDQPGHRDAQQQQRTGANFGRSPYTCSARLSHYSQTFLAGQTHEYGLRCWCSPAFQSVGGGGCAGIAKGETRMISHLHGRCSSRSWPPPPQRLPAIAPPATRLRRGVYFSFVHNHRLHRQLADVLDPRIADVAQALLPAGSRLFFSPVPP